MIRSGKYIKLFPNIYKLQDQIIQVLGSRQSWIAMVLGIK